MSTISACLIVKNEEKYLRECLESLKGAVDEIVLVDTGSTDTTVKIADEFQCIILHYEWNNNFAEARNFALRHCTKQWVLYIDADERLLKKSHTELKAIISNNINKGVYCTLKSVDETGGRPNMMKYIRLFSNHPDIAFKGRVHEQIFESLINQKYQIIDSNIELLHVGYDISLEALKLKANRNLQLLLKDFQESRDGYTAFQIGQSYGIMGQKEHAASYFQKAVSAQNLPAVYMAHSLRFLAALELEKRHYKEAYLLIEDALRADPYPPLVNLIASKVQYQLGNKTKGANFFRTAYNHNKELLSAKVVRPFEIMAAEEDMILEGLSLAIQFHIAEMFEFLLREYKNFASSNGKQGFVKELLIYDKLFHNKPINKIEVFNLLKSLNDKNYQVLIPFLKNFRDTVIRNEFIESLLKKYPGNKDLLELKAEWYEDIGKYEDAVDVYTKLFEEDLENMVIFLKMTSLLIRLNRMNELRKLIDRAELVFTDNAQSYELIQQLKKKIQHLYASE
ncbi:MAG: glycosyltransferase [Ignavibacteriales bacterium]|nr:glycosyltransferase [Ignavibacteriales bacterium]